MLTFQIVEWPLRRLTGEALFLRDVPVAAKPRATGLLVTVLGTAAPLTLAGARMQARLSEETFTFSVTPREGKPGQRHLDLRCRAEHGSRLKEEEKARVAALEAAAGVSATHSAK